MAKYDYGGGCPCGLYRECPEHCDYYVPKVEVKIIPGGVLVGPMKKDTDDFGFSLEDDVDPTVIEAELETRVKTVLDDANKKIEKIMSLINPLLDALQKDPQKTTIKWPNRAEKIKLLQTKLKEVANLRN